MRLFIGIFLGEEERLVIQNHLTQTSLPHPTLRLMEAPFWHLTLGFLDEVDVTRVDAVHQLVLTAVEHLPSEGFVIDELTTFPLKRPTRLVARAIPEQAQSWNIFVHQLRELVSVAAPHLDRKPWVPHLSLSRPCKQSPLTEWHYAFTPISWKPQMVSLIQSVPGPSGSCYMPLHEYHLHI